MKRFVICGLAVMLLAGVANAQNLTLWLADAADGDGHIIMDAPSDTAIMQLWMEIPAGMQLVNVDAILTAYDAAYGKDICFDVQGFIDHGPWGEDPAHALPDAMGRKTRGDIVVPQGLLDDYQFVAEDANFEGDPPEDMTAWSGVFGPDVILLDEIILHCICENTGSPDLVLFGFAGGPAPPGGFEVVWNPITGWGISQLGVVDVLNGTFANPFLVENFPEPATLSLLLLGGLVAFRRR